jgi:hypothetical protein
VKSQFNSQFHMGSLDDVILQALQLNSSLWSSMAIDFKGISYKPLEHLCFISQYAFQVT